MKRGLLVTIEILDSSPPSRLLFRGRPAWALLELIRAGSYGCTPLRNPAPRWSAYIHVLRNEGIAISTITESHGGQFPGHHGRYILQSNLRLVAANDNEGPNA